MDYSPKEFMEQLSAANGESSSISSSNSSSSNNNNHGETGAKTNGHKHPSDGEENDHNNQKVPLKQKKFNPKKQLKKSKYSAAQERVNAGAVSAYSVGYLCPHNLTQPTLT